MTVNHSRVRSCSLDSPRFPGLVRNHAYGISVGLSVNNCFDNRLATTNRLRFREHDNSAAKLTQLIAFSATMQPHFNFGRMTSIRSNHGITNRV